MPIIDSSPFHLKLFWHGLNMEESKISTQKCFERIYHNIVTSFTGFGKYCRIFSWNHFQEIFHEIHYRNAPPFFRKSQLRTLLSRLLVANCAPLFGRRWRSKLPGKQIYRNLKLWPNIRLLEELNFLYIFLKITPTDSNGFAWRLKGAVIGSLSDILVGFLCSLYGTLMWIIAVLW